MSGTSPSLPSSGWTTTPRLAAAFAKDHPALIAFITAGDGDTHAHLDALVAGGADVIELGMPFTDPMADGPAIQAANLRALAAGTKTADIFAIAKDFRVKHAHVPLVLMGYANPMTIRGGAWFAQSCLDAGVDGVICVDLPPEEDADLGEALRAAGVATIRLATPTSDTLRLPTLLDGAAGFLYYVSVAGITGKQQADITSIEQAVTRLKQTTSLPVAVGFGVRTPEQAAAIGRIADGVVVGSAFVDIIAARGAEVVSSLQCFTASLADALKQARHMGERKA